MIIFSKTGIRMLVLYDIMEKKYEHMFVFYVGYSRKAEKSVG